MLACTSVTPSLQAGWVTPATDATNFADNVFYVYNAATNTKKLNLALSGATASTEMTLASNQTANRTITIPDTTDTLVCLNTSDTLTNKTLITPIISSISNSGTLTLPSSTTDTLVARNTTDTLTNKTIVAQTNTVAASQLMTNAGAGNDVVVKASAPPQSGYVLTATSATAASWQSLPAAPTLIKGTATLSNSVVSVSNTNVTASSVIICTYSNVSDPSTQGSLYVNNLVAGSGFKINRNKYGDNNLVMYVIYV